MCTCDTTVCHSQIWQNKLYWHTLLHNLLRNSRCAVFWPTLNQTENRHKAVNAVHSATSDVHTYQSTLIKTKLSTWLTEGGDLARMDLSVVESSSRIYFGLVSHPRHQYQILLFDWFPVEPSQTHCPTPDKPQHTIHAMDTGSSIDQTCNLSSVCRLWVHYCPVQDSRVWVQVRDRVILT